MTYRDTILAIKPFTKEQCQRISSNEKLAAYTAKYLVEHDVPLTFDYLTVAMFRMYPEVFYLCEDFKEYPAGEKLNRTILHLVDTKNKNNILAGSATKGYALTKYGELVANQTLATLNNENVAPLEKKMRERHNPHKAGAEKEFNTLKSSSQYGEFIKTGKVSDFTAWRIYQVAPFTQNETLRASIKLAIVKAKEQSDEKLVEFANVLLAQLD